MNTEKKLVGRKLVLNRETLRTISAEQLEQVVGGITTNAHSYSCY
jgi:hypothetical protein